MSQANSKNKIKGKLATAALIVGLGGLAGYALETNPGTVGAPSSPAKVAAVQSGAPAGSAQAGPTAVTSASGATSTPAATQTVAAQSAGTPVHHQANMRSASTRTSGGGGRRARVERDDE